MPAQREQAALGVSHPANSATLFEALTTRHSSRAFLPTPVPSEALHRALSLAASTSPSNSNVQPWRLFVLTGGALARLKAELTLQATSGDTPKIPPLPAWASKSRSQLGRLVYGEGMGLARDDLKGRRAAVLRNFEFFGAPVAMVVCVPADLGPADVLSVGMHLQSLVLALRAEGLDTCVEVSIAGYPEVVKRVGGISDDMMVLCGVAVGLEDPEARVNLLRPPRMSWEETTVVLD